MNTLDNLYGNNTPLRFDKGETIKNTIRRSDLMKHFKDGTPLTDEEFKVCIKSFLLIVFFEKWRNKPFAVLTMMSDLEQIYDYVLLLRDGTPDKIKALKEEYSDKIDFSSLYDNKRYNNIEHEVYCKDINRLTYIEYAISFTMICLSDIIEEVTQTEYGISNIDSIFDFVYALCINLGEHEDIREGYEEYRKTIQSGKGFFSKIYDIFKRKNIL